MRFVLDGHQREIIILPRWTKALDFMAGPCFIIFISFAFRIFLTIFEIFRSKVKTVQALGMTMGARMARIGIVDICNTFIDYYTQMNETRWTIYYWENTLAFEFDSFIF